MKVLNRIKQIFSRGSVFIYGSLNGQIARKHKKSGNVQFILWYAGTQGHKEDLWHDFDKSWWGLFEPSNQ